MQRAEHFKKARVQSHQILIEDYTEMIADLIEKNGRARICDIAKQMGISHVAVIKTLKKLIRDGYLVQGVHPLIHLTEKGIKTAQYSKNKHSILYEFLLKIGVPKDIAATDVEGIEHHISKETLYAIEQAKAKIF